MTRDDLEFHEKTIMEEVVKRRKLGGYSMEAAGILLLCESVLALIQHAKDQLPRKK